MRKISLIMVVFVLTASAWARVDIICDQNQIDVNSVTVRYVLTGTDATVGVRAFALDISLSDDVNIVEVNDFHVGESNSVTPGYGIFPSNFASKIDPEDPDWDADGYTPLGTEADYPDDTLGGLDTNGITVELGSLYDGEVNAPALSGVLFEFTADTSENPNNTVVTLALNQIRGGIVLEDTNAPSEVNLVGTTIINCLIGGNADHGVPGKELAAWVFWGKPNCWCYQRQCRGDTDGKSIGPKPVGIPDLTILYAAYGKNDTVLATVPNGICADLDHYKTGPKRVAIPDLTICYHYYGQRTAQVPICDQADPTNPSYPGIVYTGPYNFWIVP